MGCCSALVPRRYDFREGIAQGFSRVHPEDKPRSWPGCMLSTAESLAVKGKRNLASGRESRT